MVFRFRKVVSLFVLNQVFSRDIFGGQFKDIVRQPFRLNSSTIPNVGQRLIINEFGDPNQVIYIEKFNVSLPKTDEVLVKMIFSAVNPADINTIQGVYPLKPNLPAVPGSEGVGEVIAVGPRVNNLNAGDIVIPNMECAGTWRTHALFKEEQLVKIPKDINMAAAAGLSVNPSTAYRMLKDFVDLKKGDVIVQNGANSAAGQNVIQLCKAWGIETINVVRDRPEIDKLKDVLYGMGATHVIIEEELRSSPIVKSVKPKLALNCVGGKNALNLLRLLDNGGVMVTYGGMSREPVTVPTSSFIFKDITLKGFWMTRWHGQNRNTPKQREMFEELIALIRNSSLKPPVHTSISINNYQEAIKNTMNVKGFTNVKYYLSLNTDSSSE